MYQQLHLKMYLVLTLDHFFYIQEVLLQGNQGKKGQTRYSLNQLKVYFNLIYFEPNKEINWRRGIIKSFSCRVDVIT